MCSTFLQLPTLLYRLFVFCCVELSDASTGLLGIGKCDTVSVLFDTNFSDILVVDRECGKSLSDCPRFCSDAGFRSIYCPAECQQFSPQERQLICPNQCRYVPSPSGRRLSGKWRRQYSGSRRLTGNYWTDQMNIGRSNRKGNGWEFSTIRFNVSFVSVDLFDRRIFPATCIFGLGAGDHSSIAALFESQKIRTRRVSLSKLRHPDAFRRPYSGGIGMVTIGALDGIRCAEWIFVPSISTISWAVEATNVEILGLKIVEKMTVIFSALFDGVGLPGFVVEQLLQSNRLIEYRRHSTKVNYGYKRTNSVCNQNPNITMHLNGFEFEIRKLDESDHRQGDCLLKIESDESSPHYHQPVIILGERILEEWCLGFDYDQMRMAFGRWRSRAAFPVDFKS